MKRQKNRRVLTETLPHTRILSARNAAKFTMYLIKIFHCPIKEIWLAMSKAIKFTSMVNAANAINKLSLSVDNFCGMIKLNRIIAHYAHIKGGSEII